MSLPRIEGELPEENLAQLEDSTIASAFALELARADLVRLTEEVERRKTLPELDSSTSTSIGVDFKPAKVRRNTGRRAFVVDMDRQSRGVNAHRYLEHQIAAAAQRNDLKPLRPSSQDPPFDLAWWSLGFLVLIEAKSSTEKNESKQLRIGLGQILDYADEFRGTGVRVRPVLATERPPPIRWVHLAGRHGVRLIWHDLLSDIRLWGLPVS